MPQGAGTALGAGHVLAVTPATASRWPLRSRRGPASAGVGPCRAPQGHQGRRPVQPSTPSVKPPEPPRARRPRRPHETALKPDAPLVLQALLALDAPIAKCLYSALASAPFLCRRPPSPSSCRLSSLFVVVVVVVATITISTSTNHHFRFFIPVSRVPVTLQTFFQPSL